MGSADGYGPVYRSVMRDETLSLEAKAIYAYLCAFANGDGECWPGVSLMLHDLNMGKDRFCKHMKKLLDAGIVTREQRRDKNLLRGYVYTVNHGRLISRQSKNKDADKKQPNSRQPDSREAGPRYPESRPPNNNSLNTPSFNIPRENIDIAATAASVCLILNENREKKGGAAGKGRVKAGAGEQFIRRILEGGHTAEEIIRVAREYKVMDWWKLEVAMLGSWGAVPSKRAGRP